MKSKNHIANNTTDSDQDNHKNKQQTTSNNQTNAPASSLAYAPLDDIPTPKADAKEIVGLVKSGGKVSGYQLSDGSNISKEEGVAMVKNGEIQGVAVAHRKDTEYLKSLPDGTENNNLANLPSVSE